MLTTHLLSNTDTILTLFLKSSNNAILIVLYLKSLGNLIGLFPYEFLDRIRG